ncbi:uncharacterized protein L201_003086 [Kwoniella dendrophila CBS 6074]|uniref:Uncharacterized protein n=1 Tax=Kwoniella dendrophila CBS 6074 TaxID=1295534 RepID=A0AAX4JS03_9TREE
MCIAFFTLSQPGYKLILASNRDEFLARPTSPAKWHNFSAPRNDNHVVDQVHEAGLVLSGIDKGAKDGGTWLGMTKDLRVGILTNVRHTQPTPPIKPSTNPPSRGLLLKNFLAAPPTSKLPVVHEYLSTHLDPSAEYEGFNLLLFSLSKSQAEVGYLTNRPVPCLTDLHIPSSSSSLAHETQSAKSNNDSSHIGSRDIESDDHHLPAECFGLSNSPMNQPWPKVIQGEQRMVDTLKEWSKNDESDKELVERMFAVLSHNVPIHKDLDMMSSTTIPLFNFPIRPVQSEEKGINGNDKNESIIHNPTIPVDLPPNPTTPAITTIQPEDKPRWYGTRTSTIIIVKDNGETIFVERDILELDENGNPRKGSDERWVEFQAETKA